MRLLADYITMASWMADDGESPAARTYVVDLHAGVILTDGVDPWAGILVDSDIPVQTEFTGQTVVTSCAGTISVMA
jgi:hypothetical protein